mmetsp:Transcript_28558/g.59833  ORF Transcript_28558/g.59833 Transcript_28558/m.59833 type:complete len:83 (-) Transcript_28558:41-289(-)
MGVRTFRRVHRASSTHKLLPILQNGEKCNNQINHITSQCTRYFWVLLCLAIDHTRDIAEVILLKEIEVVGTSGDHNHFVRVQ